MNVHATRDLDASRPSHPLATAKPRKPRRGRRWLAAGVAGAAAAALANHLLARRSEARHPPGGRFLEVGGVRLHYRERGEGPVIVLLHGLAGSSSTWLPTSSCTTATNSSPA